MGGLLVPSGSFLVGSNNEIVFVVVVGASWFLRRHPEDELLPPRSALNCSSFQNRLLGTVGGDSEL